MPVSMLTMSSWVSTATARASSMRADSSVSRSVASPKITGTFSCAAVDRKRLSSLRSITATSYPALTRSLTTRMPNDPRPTTMTWSRRWRTRRRPDEYDSRRDSSTSATKATRIAVVVTPANISRMPNSRSHVGCSMKLKSPYPTVAIVSVEKYSASIQLMPGGRW